MKLVRIVLFLSCISILLGTVFSFDYPLLFKESFYAVTPLASIFILLELVSYVISRGRNGEKTTT